MVTLKMVRTATSEIEKSPCKKLFKFREKNGNLLEQSPGTTMDVADIPIAFAFPIPNLV